MAKDRKLYLNERTTIRDVAQEAGVSLTTVSHALNGYKDVSEKTRQKVMEVARRLDYMPDEAGRSLRGIQKKTIALLLAGELPEEDPSGMMYGLTSGIYKIAQKMEYEFTILTMPTNKQIKISFGQICKKKKLTGIIVDGLAIRQPHLIRLKNLRKFSSYTGRRKNFRVVFVKCLHWSSTEIQSLQNFISNISQVVHFYT